MYVKYLLTAQVCPILSAPIHGTFKKCSTKPMYGESCTFKCNEGYTMIGEDRRVCERHEGNSSTYWDGVQPECQGMLHTNQIT